MFHFKFFLTNYSNYFKLSKGFTLIEVVLYLGLLILIIIILYPTLVSILSNYLILKGELDINTELRNIFLRINNEMLKAKFIDILTDWEIIFDFNNESKGFFLTKPVYLDKNLSKLVGYASNLSFGSISFSNGSYGVSFFSSSTCYTGTSSVTSLYAFSGYAWSPNVGWIKFRNEANDQIIYGVCEDNNNELRGYAYNDIIGWISFNCADRNVCGTSNYKVFERNNYLYGYAWNDTAGWIIFDGQGGRIYVSKMNPQVYYLDLISDPRMFVEDLRFSKIGESFKVNIKIKSPEGNYVQGETVISRPFK